MSHVNLLPPEIREKQTTQRKTLVVALAGVVVLVGIGFFYFLQTLDLSRANKDLDTQQAVNQDLQTQIQGLSEFGQLQSDLQIGQKLIGTVFAHEVAWSGVLLDVSRIIPSQAFLNSLKGQITAPTGTGVVPGTAPGAATNLVGNISFDGLSVGTEPIAEWLTRLEQIKGWVNSWVTTATEDNPGSNHYGFSSGVDLTSSAVTKRGAGGQQQ